MHKAPLEGGADVVGEFAGGAAFGAFDVGDVVVDEAAGEDGAVLVGEVDGVACEEAAFGGDDSGVQEGASSVAHGFDGAFIEDEAAGGRGGVSEPEAAGSAAASGGREGGADVVAGEGFAGLRHGGEHRGHTCGGGDAGCVDLGAHAAGADAGSGAADLDVLHLFDVGDERDALGAFAAGRAVVEGVDVGEQDERVGVDEVADERGEAVVVAEADLLGGDGVVLVDDRHGAVVEERLEGGSAVEVGGAAGDVVTREEYLPGGEAEALEQQRVGRHDLALADCGGGLRLGKRGGPRLHPERRHACGDGAGGDEEHFLARVATFGEDADELGERGVVDAPTRVCDGRRTDLDDDAFGIANLLAKALARVGCRQRGYSLLRLVERRGDYWR